MNFQGAVLDRGRSESIVGPTYFPAFDYLRICVAAGVFVSHAHSVENLGNACVQIFFALSGFLIGGILLRSGRSDLARFYFNRSTRIWIPYGIAILLLFAATALKQSLADAKIWEFFFYDITFVYNWFGPPQLATSVLRMPLNGTGNHFWSICVEEQFYLLAPFLLLFVSRQTSILMLVALFAVNFFYSHDFAAIALGVLLAISRERFGDWYLTRTGLAAVLIVGGCSALLMGVGIVSYSKIFPLIAVTIVGSLAFEGPANQVGKTLGGMSFSFYLNHWIGLFVANGLLKSAGALVAWPVGLGVAMMMSWLHYRYIDLAIARNRASYFNGERGHLALAVGFSLVTVGLIAGLIFAKWPIV
jgi:peptidoglycan/LPS O-acetylase OafA/YrhL